MSDSAYSNHSLRVLVVDGHQDSLDIATEVLITDCNANVLAVNTARHAYEVVPAFQPHLLISELLLSDEDGYVLMETLKSYMAEQYNYLLPAIALTAQVSPEAKARALAVGYRRHIAKPYRFETLVESVAQLAESDVHKFQACSSNACPPIVRSGPISERK